MSNVNDLFCISMALLPLFNTTNETTTDNQYNAIAKKYSELVAENNQDSIAAYFRYLDIPMKGKSVLDLGCGDGYDLSQIQLKGALIFGIDSSPAMIEIAQKKNPTSNIKIGYFENIPFADNSLGL